MPFYTENGGNSMKNKTVKKLICMLLCALMVLSTPLGVMAVELNSAPVIYVGDISDNALYAYPNTANSSAVFDMSSSAFIGSTVKMISGFALYATGFGIADINAAATTLSTGIKEIMDPILCNEKGTSKNSSISAWDYSDPISAYKDDVIYTENVQAFAKAAAGYVSEDEIFFFSYDWRLDPTDNADELMYFIDHVKEETGKNKVAILATGNGGIIVNSYLYEYEGHAEDSLTSVVLYNTSIYGNALVGDIMRGRITRKVEDAGGIVDIYNEISGTNRGDAIFSFVKGDSMGFIDDISTNLLGSGSVSLLIGKLFSLLITTILESQDVDKTYGKSYNNFMDKAAKTIYKEFLKEYLRNIPGIWALVPEKDFYDAYEFMFEDAIASGALDAKINAYRKVQDNTSKTLETAKNNGINVCVVSTYGYQLLPVTVSLNDVSNGIDSVKYSSIGAKTADSGEEIDNFVNCENEKHNHISPEEDIDASYCILPENTWFIKNVPHGDITAEGKEAGDRPVATFLVWLIFGFTQRNIRESASYPQFMEYSRYSKTIIANATAGDDANESGYGDVDYDGKVDASDARAVLRIAVGLDEASKETRIVADVDGNEKVEAADARLVLRYAVGLDLIFPVQK